MWHEFSGIVTAEHEQGQAGFVARCHEWPGASGRGPTADAALRNLACRLADVLARRTGDRPPGPPPARVH